VPDLHCVRARLVSLVALVVLAAPLAAEAQTTAERIVRIGYLHIQPIMPEPSPERRAFLEGLRTLGYEDCRTSSSSTAAASCGPNSFPTSWRSSSSPGWT
jgi:hypothetical protein